MAVDVRHLTPIDSRRHATKGGTAARILLCILAIPVILQPLTWASTITNDCQSCCGDQSLSDTLPDYPDIMGQVQGRALGLVNSGLGSLADGLLDSARSSVESSDDRLALRQFDLLRPQLKSGLVSGMGDIWNDALASPFGLVINDTSRARGPATPSDAFFPALTPVSASLSPIFRFSAPHISDLPGFLNPLRSGDLGQFGSNLLDRSTVGVTGGLDFGEWHVKTEILASPQATIPFFQVDRGSLSIGMEHLINAGGHEFLIDLSASIDLGRGADGRLDALSENALLSIIARSDPCQCTTSLPAADQSGVPEPSTVLLSGLGVTGLASYRRAVKRSRTSPSAKQAGP